VRVAAVVDTGKQSFSLRASDDWYRDGAGAGYAPFVDCRSTRKQTPNSVCKTLVSNLDGPDLLFCSKNARRLVVTHH
jgi:hypothetical protein